jgi:hypothetical protein
MDETRLVMPPALLAVLASLVYIAMRPVFAPAPDPVYNAVFGSGLAAYVAYDVFHYAHHHVTATPGTYFGFMKRYHLKHHFAGIEGVAFGVTSTLYVVTVACIFDLLTPFLSFCCRCAAGTNCWVRSCHSVHRRKSPPLARHRSTTVYLFSCCCLPSVFGMSVVPASSTLNLTSQRFSRKRKESNALEAITI